jgi:hypothetical protein
MRTVKRVSGCNLFGLFHLPAVQRTACLEAADSECVAWRLCTQVPFRLHCIGAGMKRHTMHCTCSSTTSSTETAGAPPHHKTTHESLRLVWLLCGWASGPVLVTFL